MANEFEWIKEIKPHPIVILGPSTIIYNSDIENDPFMLETQKQLFSVGCGWHTFAGGMNFNLFTGSQMVKSILAIVTSCHGDFFSGFFVCQDETSLLIVSDACKISYTSHQLNNIPNHAIRYIY